MRVVVYWLSNAQLLTSVTCLRRLLGGAGRLEDQNQDISQAVQRLSGVCMCCAFQQSIRLCQEIDVLIESEREKENWSHPRPSPIEFWFPFSVSNVFKWSLDELYYDVNWKYRSADAPM